MSDAKRPCACGCGGEVRGEARTRYIQGHHARLKQDYEVDTETGCWLWLGAKNQHGYGLLQRGGRNAPGQSAHRWYYEQHKGSIPEGLEIDHLCHVRACVNPEHLEAVTGLLNLHRRRSNTLTREAVREIRATGMNRRQIVERWGISLRHADSIRNGSAWRVTDDA